jgi:hypothetical protein
MRDKCGAPEPRAEEGRADEGNKGHGERRSAGDDSPSLRQGFLTVEGVPKTVIFAAYNDGINGSSIAIDAGVTLVI